MEIANHDWVISQVWRDVLFLNYKVDPRIIQESLPEPLKVDTLNGDAYLSVVPFRMTGIRFPYTPVLPHSKLWELNLRTYVEYQGIKGIYFYTLDTDHHLAQWIANTFFHLPYRYRYLQGRIEKGEYYYESPGSFKVEARLTTVPVVIEEYHQWLVERYSLYTEKQGSLWRGDVIHRPWDLCYAKVSKLEEGLRSEFFPGIDPDLDSVFYSQSLPVYFRPFLKLK